MLQTIQFDAGDKIFDLRLVGTLLQLSTSSQHFLVDLKPALDMYLEEWHETRGRQRKLELLGDSGEDN